jgi:Tfp pilus assembly protein PilV
MPGMNLVDMLIASVVLATVFTSLPQAFTAAVRANAAAREITWSAVLAARKVEELRSQPFPEADGVEQADVLDRTGEPPDRDSSPAFRRTWRVEPWPPAPDTAVVISVVVVPFRNLDRRGVDEPAPDGAHLVTLRTKKAP